MEMASRTAPRGRQGRGAVLCAVCNGRTTEHLGEVRVLDSAFARFLCGGPPRAHRSLFRCRRCRAVFVHPLPPEELLISVYRQLPDSLWQGKVHRYWRGVNKALGTLTSGGRVLDIGCYSGDFLAQLDGVWEKFGIEPCAAAAARAEARTIRILGETVGSLADRPGEFDAIVMLDVLEHVVRPLEFVQLAAGALRPGGVLVISTGNPDAFSWEMYGPEYYYWRLAEHFFFFGPDWFRWMSRRLRLELVGITPFRHGAWAVLPHVCWLGRCMLYFPLAVCRRLGLRAAQVPLLWRFTALNRMGKKFARALVPREGSQARNHIRVVLRSGEAS